MALSQSEGLSLRYLRVANILLLRILDGDCPPGKRFPPQHDLARERNVSFSTLKHALSILEEEGYVVPKVGDGTYAALPEKQITTAFVVDDEKNIREFFERVLSANDWTAVGADSGRAALERLSGQRFDLIFLDLIMPGMSGVDTFREIRKADPNAYVVIITGYPDSAHMVAALDIGPFAVVKKPFTVDELLVVLKHASRSLEPRSRVRTDAMRDPISAVPNGLANKRVRGAMMRLWKNYLATKFIVTAFLLTLVSIAIVGTIGFYLGRQGIETHTDLHLQSVVALKSEQVLSWVESRFTILNRTLYPGRPSKTVDRLLSAEPGSKDYDDLVQLLETETRQLKHPGSAFTDLAILDGEGRVHYASNPQLSVGSTAEAYERGSEGIYVALIWESPGTMDAPVLVIAEPTRGDVQGVILAPTLIHLPSRPCSNQMPLWEIAVRYILSNRKAVRLSTMDLPVHPWPSPLTT